VSSITETNKKIKDQEEISLAESIFETNLRTLLKACYQCGRCSGVCQLSKVQKYPPSRIIQLILEGFEDKVFNDEILWDCLTCNACLQNCPQEINFAEIVKIARYKMRKEVKQNPEKYIAHKGIYTSISELMATPNLNPERDLSWVPKECKISDKGQIMYYVGCIPFFKFEFQGLDSIAISTLKIICKIENDPIVVLKDEICCGHDIYWGQGKLDEFLELGKRNIAKFENAGINTIITACAECYRTLKIDYVQVFEGFSKKYEVKHLIEYIYDNWKKNKIVFRKPIKKEQNIKFTYHDPCRLSRFLSKDNKIIDKTREIFKEFKNLGYEFKEMVHNKTNSLCCGVSSWMNCNEKSKALRYKRMLEAKKAGDILVTSCPKCNIHLTCVTNDFEELKAIEIIDFSQFIVDHIEIVEDGN